MTPPDELPNSAEYELVERVNSWKAFGPGATSEKKVPFSPRRVWAPSIRMSAPRPCPPLIRKLVAFVPVLPEVEPVDVRSFDTTLLSRKMNDKGERPPLSEATSNGNSRTCRSLTLTCCAGGSI